jgi:hypothetical protein
MTPKNTRLPIRVIELAGLPGTGKSTVAQCLESILGKARIPIRSRSVALADQSSFVHRQQSRLRLIARNANRCSRLYRHSFRLVVDSAQRSTLDFAIVMSNLWSIIAMMAEDDASNDRVMIADQGLVQAIWSVQLSSLRGVSLDEWTPLLLAAGVENTLVAHLRTAIPLSRLRVSSRARNRTRLDLGDPEEQSRRWQIAAENMDALVEWTRRTMPCDQYGGRVLSVMNEEGAPEAAAAEIASAYFRRNSVVACA